MNESLTNKNIISGLDHLKINTRPFLAGKFVEPKTLPVLKKISPIDGRRMEDLFICDKGIVNDAVDKAKKSFEQGIWSELTLTERRSVLLKLADLMEKNRFELALLDTIETGRSFKNYYYDSIPKAIHVVRWFAEASDKYLDRSIPLQKLQSARIVREPLGVVVGITPWNDPLVPAMWKLAPALLMGNSVIMKPSELSSYSILKIAEFLNESGLPHGVLSVLTGTGELTGKSLALNNNVDGVFFTGSSAVGKLILQYSGQSNMKKVGLECGGKSPFIVAKSCGDLQLAVKTLAQNMFYNQGQICSAPSLAFIHKDIEKEFKSFLEHEMEKFIPDNALTVDANVGGVISAEQKERIYNYIEGAKSDGIKFYEPSRSKSTVPNQQCVHPICFYDVKESHSIFKEEIFGPVLIVNTFENLSEAINSANRTKFGLAASIWSDNINEAHHVSRKLRAGIVHINSYGNDDMTAPFGGIKQSGLGKDKSLYAFNEYTELKTIWTEFCEPDKIL